MIFYISNEINTRWDDSFIPAGRLKLKKKNPEYESKYYAFKGKLRYVAIQKYLSWTEILIDYIIKGTFKKWPSILRITTKFQKYSFFLFLRKCTLKIQSDLFSLFMLAIIM